MSPLAARRGVDAFAVVVALSIGIALAGLTWRLMGDPGIRLEPVSTPPRARRPIDIERLIASAPFGNTITAATQATDQSVVLRGVMLAEPRTASAALISVAGGAPAPFGIGQAVGPGTITEIEADHVVFATNGGRQILAFPDRRGAGDGVALPRVDMTVGSVPTTAPTVAPPPPPNGSTLLSGIGTPADDGLHVGQPSPQMATAGLQPGDVVTTINGLPAGDAARNPAALATALGSGVARLDVTRAGKHLTLSIPLR